MTTFLSPSPSRRGCGAVESGWGGIETVLFFLRRSSVGSMSEWVGEWVWVLQFVADTLLLGGWVLCVGPSHRALLSLVFGVVMGFAWELCLCFLFFSEAWRVCGDGDGHAELSRKLIKGLDKVQACFQKWDDACYKSFICFGSYLHHYKQIERDEKLFLIHALKAKAPGAVETALDP